MTVHPPPRGAEFFAATLIADAELRDAVLGDLSEEHAHIAATRSRSAGNAWYWWQLVRSAVPFSVMATSRGGVLGWIRLAIAVVVSYMVLAKLVIATDAFVLGRIGASFTAWQMSAASLTLGVGCGIVGGYIAAAIGGRSPIAPALTLGIACTALAVMMLPSGASGGPFIYQVSLALIVLPSCLAGALLRAHQILRRNRAAHGAPK